MFATVDEVLLESAIHSAPKPVRVLAAEETFALADTQTRDGLDAALRRVAGKGALQGWEAWRTLGRWIDTVNPRFSFEVADTSCAALTADVRT